MTQVLQGGNERIPHPISVRAHETSFDSQAKGIHESQQIRTTPALLVQYRLTPNHGASHRGSQGRSNNAGKCSYGARNGGRIVGVTSRLHQLRIPCLPETMAPKRYSFCEGLIRKVRAFRISNLPSRLNRPFLEGCRTPGRALIAQFGVDVTDV